MEISINEDGGAKVTTAGYTAFYGKNGGLKLVSGGSNSILNAPATLVIHDAFKQKAEKEPAPPQTGTYKRTDEQGL
ncbi:hypothetical protein [Xenorhabdus ehlersii]|uniref:Uncharacterized protein n=1 Tax=Xenorhabdus ehlersii TaxID=290111 RepID=A0A2D0IKC1_9GAMM|nr:hypothetical protein [Xenorhabdus ehlersii]PHM22223.1 hypothetical protein Xehl_03827 [Xenorhabdus ehlersii]RKE90567.1 hypothetical protein BDE27_2445 [Xenorhabdus ehlersii]